MKIYEIHVREYEVDTETGRQETKNVQTITKCDVSQATSFSDFINDLIDHLRADRMDL